MSIDDLFWLAYCVYCEARGESTDGQKAVAKVILNRGKGSNIQDVVLKPWQFSSFNSGLRPVISETLVFRQVLLTCDSAYDEWNSGDKLKGANLYYNPSKCSPDWADSSKVTFIATIGNHKFMKE